MTALSGGKLTDPEQCRSDTPAGPKLSPFPRLGTHYRALIRTQPATRQRHCAAFAGEQNQLAQRWRTQRAAMPVNNSTTLAGWGTAAVVFNDNWLIPKPRS